LWKWNGRAHCGDHLDGRFLYTLTLTDLATGWTECLPLLEKSADAVLAALAQARTLFPFPLLGIGTDSGSEFLNAEVIGYCEQEQLTFTRGRPGVKNDQCHVEQKNGAVVRKAVGCARLVGMQEMRVSGRDPKTLQWHQTELSALRRYLWRQFQLADIGSLTGVCLQAWVSDLPFVLSARTGATRTISTVAAYARSARAFCNWLALQGYVSETLFPQGLVPKARRGLPQAVEPEAFVRLLRACQHPGEHGGPNSGIRHATAPSSGSCWTRDCRCPSCVVYASRMWTAFAER
jgi:hypothetical protein